MAEPLFLQVESETDCMLNQHCLIKPSDARLFIQSKHTWGTQKRYLSSTKGGGNANTFRAFVVLKHKYFPMWAGRHLNKCQMLILGTDDYKCLTIVCSSVCKVLWHVVGTVRPKINKVPKYSNENHYNHNDLKNASKMRPICLSSILC